MDPVTLQIIEGRLPTSAVRATLGLNSVVAWDSFSRPDKMDGQGSLGTAESGHDWIDVTEPPDGWGAGRDRYFGVKDQTARTVNGINSGTAIAVVSDDALALEGIQGIVVEAELIAGGVGDPTPPAGVMVRYVDANNWIACGITDGKRDLSIIQCKAGSLSVLANVRLHAETNLESVMRIRGDVAFDAASDALVVAAYAEGFGTSNGASVVFNEVDDPAWFASLAGATKVGMTGGRDEVFSGWSARKLVSV